MRAVVFGSDLTATNWAKAQNIPRENVVLATHPELLVKLSGPVVVVRVSEDKWQPMTHPDEKRVKETEQILKAYKRKGEDVRDVELI
jgi:hypothetical protein